MVISSKIDTAALPGPATASLFIEFTPVLTILQ
jgi:hypothetical protein